MVLKEYDGDLFSINDRDTYYAQGISADFVMKKGISVKFNMAYNTRERLVAKYGNYLNKSYRCYKNKNFLTYVSIF